MRVTLTKQFRFEASHRLDHLPVDHPCHNLHGHSYQVEVTLTGDVNPATGFLIDYADIKRSVQPIIDQLDHSHLNDVEDLRYSTTELIAEWLWQRIKPRLPDLTKITIMETATTRCEYTGPTDD